MKTFNQFLTLAEESFKQLDEMGRMGGNVPGGDQRRSLAMRASQQRASLGVVRGGNGGPFVAKPGATSYDPEKGSQAITLANRLNRETGLNKPRLSTSQFDTKYGVNKPVGDEFAAARRFTRPVVQSGSSNVRPPSGSSNVRPPVVNRPSVAPKAPEKTYDVGGKQMSKSSINTEYERLRKSDPKAAVEFGKRANQSIYKFNK